MKRSESLLGQLSIVVHMIVWHNSLMTARGRNRTISDCWERTLGCLAVSIANDFLAGRGHGTTDWTSCCDARWMGSWRSLRSKNRFVNRSFDTTSLAIPIHHQHPCHKLSVK